MNRFVSLGTQFSLFLLLSTLVFQSCTPEAPMEGEEEIDTVQLVFAGQTIIWREGDPSDPTITLAANTSESVSIEFLNEATNENITEEVAAEKDEHLVCYSSGSSLDLTIEVSDQDGANLPVGLSTDWTIGEPSTGTVTVELRHQPGVKDGTCAPGDTDVQVTFEVVIE
jgi:hypothetical protein